MKNSPIVVFDFDGTIADTFALTVDIFYRLRPGISILPIKEVDRLRGMAVTEVLKELHVRWWEAPLLLFRGKRAMAKRMHEATIIIGMHEVLRTLHERGYELHVVSSNSVGNIRKLFDSNQITAFFHTIRGNARLHGKAQTLRKLAENHPNGGRGVIYVGDEVRDVRAAQTAGVRSIAVSWGYNNIEVLHDSGPDVMVSDPEKIVETIDAWMK